MSPCPDENVLATLADGTIDDGARAAVEAHLDGCLECTTVLAELAWIVAPARRSPARYRLLHRHGGEPALRESERWIAEDIELGRRVVVRFERAAPHRIRAATAAARLGPRPHLVEVLEAGELDEELYVVECDTAGEPIEAWQLRRSPDEIVAMWRQVIEAALVLHRAGIAHGAIAPEHVIAAEHGALLGGIGAVPDKSSGLVAPECLRGVGVPTERSDQFALCASLWMALARKPPYQGATVGALAVKMTARPVPPAAGDPALFAVVARGLSHAPTDRWPDLGALLVALDRRVTRTRWVALAVGLALAAAGTIAAMIAT